MATAGSLTAIQTISVVDPWARAPVTARPFGVASSALWTYTTRLDVALVTSIQLNPFVATLSVPVGHTPTDVAVNPSGTIALVTNQSDGTVGVIDLVSNQQTRTINAGGSTLGHCRIWQSLPTGRRCTLLARTRHA